MYFLMSARIATIRYAIHKIFAHPLIICWILGTLTIWIPLSIEFAKIKVFETSFNNVMSTLNLLLCYAATLGLGFFIGGVFISWIVLPICRRFNGAPHEVGENVIVLSGPYAGRVGIIYAIAIGQGGQPLPRVELGDKERENFANMFKDYALLRISETGTI